MNYFLIAMGIYALKVILKMHWIATLITALGIFLMLPKHKKQYGNRLLQKNRFFEVSEYLDSLLYAFAKEEKVDRALEEVNATLLDGKMKTKVQEAMGHMRMTFDDSMVMTDALALIEEEYPCSRIHTIHDFIVHVEQFGGRIEHPIKLLLADKRRWEQRITTEMKNRKKSFSDIVMSVVASLAICGIILYLPVMNMDISANPICQGLTVFVIFMDELILLKAQKYVAVDWLCLDVKTGETDGKRMEEYLSYQPKKAVLTSVLLFVPFAVISAILFWKEHSFLGLISLALALLMLNQHRVGHFLLKRNLTKSIKCAFPNWLLDIVLLLQSENVQMSIQKSRRQAQPVLHQAIDTLNERLEMEPESVAPYHAFLQDFSVPEIHSAMSMLFSVSMGQSKQADRQIGELIDRNLQMLDVAEKERISNLGSGMYLLFLAPVLTASFKLVIDMGVFMLSFLTSSGI